MKIDLSNSEWKLMNRLWQTAPMTITELTAALREELKQWLQAKYDQFSAGKGLAD